MAHGAVIERSADHRWSASAVVDDRLVEHVRADTRLIAPIRPFWLCSHRRAEHKIANRTDSQGRVYARLVDGPAGRWQVLISHKSEQSRDIEWLRRL
jgi:hypothetical protein